MQKPKPNFFQRRTKFQGPRTNERIRSLDVQVINSSGENLGVLPIKKAIEAAIEQIKKQTKDPEAVVRLGDEGQKNILKALFQLDHFHLILL